MKKNVLIILAILSLYGCQSNQSKQSASVSYEPTLTESKSQTSVASIEMAHIQETTQTKTQSKTSTNATQESTAIVTTTQENRIVSVPTEKRQKKLLSVSEQVQKEWHFCAPTTVSMMLSIKGIHVDQYQLAKEMGTYEPFGTHNKDAIKILNRHLFGYDVPQSHQSGYRLEHVSDVEQALPKFTERMIKNIQDGYPMYYTMDVSKIYPGLKGEHNVVGIGYELDENGEDIAYVYYIDPSTNVRDSQYGGLKKISPRQLLESMLTCVEPNYAW